MNSTIKTIYYIGVLGEGNKIYSSFGYVKKELAQEIADKANKDITIWKKLLRSMAGHGTEFIVKKLNIIS